MYSILQSDLLVPKLIILLYCSSNIFKMSSRSRCVLSTFLLKRSINCIIFIFLMVFFLNELCLLVIVFLRYPFVQIYLC